MGYTYGYDELEGLFDRLNEHVRKVREFCTGGFVSSVAKEIRTFATQIKDRCRRLRPSDREKTEEKIRLKKRELDDLLGHMESSDLLNRNIDRILVTLNQARSELDNALRYL